MPNDDRHEAAAYYDKYSSPPWDDVSFYISRLPHENARVLELGCGTGRVLLPMIEHTAYIHGLDQSPGMLEICQRKLHDAAVAADRARAEVGDITDFDLTGRMPRFDLITAPFRVMQNLEADEQVAGLMRCIGKHLAPGGQAILNTFRPRGDYETLEKFWSVRDGSEPAWEKHVDGEGTVTMTDICTEYSDDPVLVRPKLIYRRFDAQGNQVDEAVLDIVMRVWYPDELVDLVESNGFRVTGQFGGYEGESWGEGGELVIAFTA